jgi:hypothetical protein
MQPNNLLIEIVYLSIEATGNWLSNKTDSDEIYKDYQYSTFGIADIFCTDH